MNRPVAVIDVGTNTARLLIGDRDEGGSIRHLLLRRCITRLGGGFSQEKGISADARQRTIEALSSFAAEIARHEVGHVRAVTTSAVRDAVNGAEFCREAYAETGISMEVIDGEAEGRLMLAGVLSALSNREDDLFVFDVGGGSTEYTVARHREPVLVRSLPLGVVRLTEGKPDLPAMEEKILRELLRLKDALLSSGHFPMPAETILVGTAGTATTLAAISMKMTEYDYRSVNNYRLTLKEIEDIYTLLLPLPPAQRLLVPGLEKGREDLIIAGTLLTIKSMHVFGFKEMTVSDFGLLEGLLQDSLAALAW